MAAAGATTTAVLKETKASSQAAAAVEVELAKCECCGLTEECTLAYTSLVRERFGGRWICGLCSEAVKDEKSRSKKDDMTTSHDELEALKQHMKFCQQFRSSTPPANPTQDLISVIKHMLRQSLDSPRKKKGSVYPSLRPSVQ